LTATLTRVEVLPRVETVYASFQPSVLQLCISERHTRYLLAVFKLANWCPYRDYISYRL